MIVASPSHQSDSSAWQGGTSTRDNAFINCSLSGRVRSQNCMLGRPGGVKPPLSRGGWGWGGVDDKGCFTINGKFDFCKLSQFVIYMGFFKKFTLSCFNVFQ